MKYLKLRFLQLLIVALLAWSCDSDDPEPQGVYSTGMFVLNEGAYGNSNASVSYFSPAGDSIQNKIFSKTNNRPLGDVLQSATAHDGNVYLVLNGSNKVEVVSSLDFKEQNVIEGLNGPRYMAFAGNKGFISQWGNGGQVVVYDPQNMETTTKIDVGTGPEAMVDVNGELWVANSGGFGNDSIISVIDPAQETVIKSIEVGHVPKDFVIDAEGDVWVLCIGNIKYDENYNVVSETPSKLFEISPVDYEIKSEVKLFDKKHPGHLEISDEKNTLYVGGSFGFTGIYTMSTGADALNVEPLIDSKSFYGISVHPETGEIYGLEAPSFKSGGDFYIYSESGTEKAKYSVDIGPNAILF